MSSWSSRTWIPSCYGGDIINYYSAIDLGMPADTTTLQVQKKTKALLDLLKGTYGSRTYDDVIQKLVMKKTGSMAGKFKMKGKSTMQQIMRGMRDENDRF